MIALRQSLELCGSTCIIFYSPRPDFMRKLRGQVCHPDCPTRAKGSRSDRSCALKNAVIILDLGR